jgi:hypothetical protein
VSIFIFSDGGGSGEGEQRHSVSKAPDKTEGGKSRPLK